MLLTIITLSRIVFPMLIPQRVMLQKEKLGNALLRPTLLP
jgi:hypothetical protein